jgi:hypothetical protein
MRRDKLLALAQKVGFVIDRHDRRAFQFEAIGFCCVAFMFYERQSDEVISLQLLCGFDEHPDPRAVEAWNREARFVKARTSALGQLILEMDLIVPKEMTAEHLKDAWRIWNQLLARVSLAFGGPQAGTPISNAPYAASPWVGEPPTPSAG